jgi:hypothetical protein
MIVFPEIIQTMWKIHDEGHEGLDLDWEMSNVEAV